MNPDSNPCQSVPGAHVLSATAMVARLGFHQPMQFQKHSREPWLGCQYFIERLLLRSETHFTFFNLVVSGTKCPTQSRYLRLATKWVTLFALFYLVLWKHLHDTGSQQQPRLALLRTYGLVKPGLWHYLLSLSSLRLQDFSFWQILSIQLHFFSLKRFHHYPLWPRLSPSEIL